jgi:phosphate transport system substrate-binding protein
MVAECSWEARKHPTDVTEEKRMKTDVMKILTVLVVLVPAILLVACAQPTPVPAEPTVEVALAPTEVPPTLAVPTQPVSGVELPAVDPLAVTGDIVSAGSSTVFPLSEAIADMFKADGYTGQITIDSIGTGAGFERFCTAGETDIANASRAIKDEEKAACLKIGRDPLELRIATDAMAVVVSTANDFVDGLTKDELAVAFTTAETWADVRAGWPAEPIQRFSPGTDSGTFDYFVEVILAKEKQPLLDAKNLQLSEDDNVLVQGVEGSPYAIGYFGYAYLEENLDRLKAVPIDGVEPSKATVDAGTYPLARPLFLYTTAKILSEKPQVASFISYYLAKVNDAVEKVGYFPASTAALDATKTLLKTTIGQ